MGLPKPCIRTALNCYRIRWLPSPIASPRHAALLRNRSAWSTARVLRPEHAQEPRIPLCTGPTTGDKPSGGNPSRVGVGPWITASSRVRGRWSSSGGHGFCGDACGIRELGAARDGRVVILMRWPYISLRCTAVAGVNAPTSEFDLVLGIRAIDRGNGHVGKSSNGRNPQLPDGPLGAVWVQSVGTAE